MPRLCDLQIGRDLVLILSSPLSAIISISLLERRWYEQRPNCIIQVAVIESDSIFGLGKIKKKSQTVHSSVLIMGFPLHRFGRHQRPSSDAEKDKEIPQLGSREDAENNAILLKRGTKTRRNAIVVVSVFYVVAIALLILVEVGSTRKSTALGSIYFFKLDLTNVLAQSVPSSLTLQNTIARSLGLHDFYQIGLWNFCEGYQTDGITHCTKPEVSFWFNPVQILLDELVTGASIALPSEINSILNILRIAFHTMFGFFLGGIILNGILLVISPIVLYSRWWSLPVGIISSLSALVIVVAAILGTVIAYVFQAALSSQPELGVSASIGTRMLVFEWTAAAFTLLAFFIHAGLGCCCTSRRDMRTGRNKKGGNAQQVS
ncbi:SUR7/PalI family-domain-containing protein [Xylaria intraflava]|nr:SUR7/PalI family-domain-containing protein [Xylaria intraflava]